MSEPTRARHIGESRTAMRALVVAATAGDLSTAELRVVLVVLELTAGHGKLVDRVARSDLARRARVSERTVTRAMPKLARFGVRWEPARARGQLGTLMVSRVDDPPDGMTRDEWRSRVQPANAGQIDTERETPPGATRDTQDVPVPPLTTIDHPRCEHNFVFGESGRAPDGCRRERAEAIA